MTWLYRIYNTQTGQPRLTFEVSGCSWSTSLTGQGTGTHTIPLFGEGISQEVIRAYSTGNQFTICQIWNGHVVYAGVIQRVQYSPSTRALTVYSAELRTAYLDSRMLFGVFSYTPGGTALAVSGKSRSGAARAVLDRATSAYWGSFWTLPIDLPADGSGSFSATWLMEERLTLEDHLKQIEDDGCEIYFRPYLDGDGWLRWETLVQTKVTIGSATALSFGDPDTPLEDVTVTIDYAREMTGILGFGKGGTDAEAYGYTPGDGAEDISVRDMWVSYPDLTGSRLIAAVEALDSYGYPVEQWSFGVSVFPDGPAFVCPGRRLAFTSSGDEFIVDGTYQKRVVSARGDAGHMVTVEVQDAS